MEFRQWLLKNVGGAAAAVLILAVLLLLLGLDISRRTGAIIRQRQDLASHSQSLNSLALLRSEAERANKIRGAIQDFLPSGDQLISFPKSLEGLAKSNQLGFGFTFNSEVAGSVAEPAVSNFTLVTRGLYNNFLNFLKAVEKSKYFVGFELFDLNRKDKDFEIIMKGKVFSQ